jgi:hypothetical protein
MIGNIPARFRIAALLVLAVLGSLWLGISLEQVFAQGFTLDLSLWVRFIPLLLAFLLSAAFLTVISLTAPAPVRAGGIVLSAVAFGLPFMVPPNPVEIPLVFTLLIALAYSGSIMLLDYTSKRAVKTHAIFEATMFSPAYGRFFQSFVFAVGILVYFSARIPADFRFQIPEEILNPALNLVVNRVIEQVRGELGTKQFTEEQFLAELEKTGLLQVLEQQFGITLDPQEVSTPEKLTENLRQPLVDQLTADLEGLLEPYLPFLPLAAAVGMTLSLLFLTPVFALISVGAFGLIYRLLIASKFAALAQEQRQVPVLKINDD